MPPSSPRYFPRSSSRRRSSQSVTPISRTPNLQLVPLKRVEASADSGSSMTSFTKGRHTNPLFSRTTALPFQLTPTSLFVTLPLPPSINHQYATVRGRRILSSTGRRYKAEINRVMGSFLASSALRHHFLQRLPSHFLGLQLHFYFPTLLRRDLDGGLKIAQDALCQALGTNDNRILEIHLKKSVDPSTPRLESTLYILNPVSKPSRPRKTSTTRFKR